MNAVGMCNVCDEPVFTDQPHRSFARQGVKVTYHLICLFSNHDADFVPLEAQIARYEENWEGVVRGLQHDLISAVYRQHLHDLGLERLREGFRVYRDEMYHWHSAVREANQDEELADFIVYGTSE